jgi:hypothetical protein
MTDAELFAHYKTTAPIEDLRFSLRLALQRLATYELPDVTIGLTAEMAALETEIRDVKGTPALLRRVWSLISRYRASIPGWCGAAGAKDGWVDFGIDSDDAYRTAQAELIDAEEALAGPVSFDFVRACFDRLTKRSAEINGIKVPRRAVELTPEEVATLVPVASSSAEPRKTKSKPKTEQPLNPSIPCPSLGCKGRLATTGFVASAGMRFTLKCDTCKEVWELHSRSVEQPKPERAKAARKPRPPVVPINVDANGERICPHCQQSRPSEEFYAQHSTRCRSCRIEYRKQLAARKAQAA